MVGGFRNAIGDVEEENSKGEQHDDTNLYFLSRGAIEDGEKEDGGHHGRKDHVHDIKRVATS